MNNNTHIGIIGAGIIGVSSALWLQKKGFKVTLIDGNQPGSITSSGNACTIADYGCVPVNDPGLVKRLPQLLFGKNSPLSFNPWYAFTHLPWMLSFLRNCQPARVQTTINALGTILKDTNSGLDPLIDLTGTRDLFVTNGCMYVYKNQLGFDAARAGNLARADQGAEFSELGRNDIHDLEPNLSPIFEKGLLFGNARQVLNPQSLVNRFFRYFIDSGGTYKNDHAKEIIDNQTGLQILLHNGEKLAFDKALVSCGAFSKQIGGCEASTLPLDTERGYHIQYADHQHLVNRPVAWAEAGFYATPMNEGLRFAGTVEIAGLSDKKNSQNLLYLSRMSRKMLNLPEQPDSDWLGYRPTLPDSLPVIGQSTTSENIYFSFGHQHIGLTLAGISGKLISELIAGEPLSSNIEPFRPDRFKGATDRKK